MALVKKGPFLWLFMAIKFYLSLVITFMAFYDCVRTLTSTSTKHIKDIFRQTHQKYEEHLICGKAQSPLNVFTPKKTRSFNGIIHVITA